MHPPQVEMAEQAKDGVGDGVRVEVVDARVALREAVRLDVEVRDGVTVRDAVGENVRPEGVAEGVRLGVGVRLDGSAVRLRVGVPLGVRERLGVTLEEKLAVGEALRQSGSE